MDGKEERLNMTPTITGALPRTIDEDYVSLRRAVAESYLSIDGPIFTTDASGLFDAYINGISAEYRQQHNCRNCQQFIERFGGLVTISAEGVPSPAMIPADGYGFQASIDEMVRIIRLATVTGVFLSSETEYGKAVTGAWKHFAVTPKTGAVFATTKLRNAAQATAEKSEDLKTVERALSEFPLSVIDQALTLLRSDALYRSEKVLGQAEWLKSLHTARAATKNERHKRNILWLAVATAPAGFCHPRSSMIGTLLEDISAGKDFGDVSRAFTAKMHPLQYQRPQAAPTSGSIANAERLFAMMGMDKSLVRRYARLEEVPCIWKPSVTSKPEQSGGIFSHLKAKGDTPVPAMNPPSQTVTWVKFRETALPIAKRIQYLVATLRPPFQSSYGALVTAAHDDAPPIMQWDSPGTRNPFSWYLYRGGSPASQWGLQQGWHEVKGFSLNPSKWADEKGFAHQGDSVMAIIEGAKDSRYEHCGNALFPETLKADLREVRAVIEAYSKSAVIQGQSESSACGLMMSKGQTGIGASFRVTTEAGTLTYTIDRWD
jgi:hypothetical protein